MLLVAARVGALAAAVAAAVVGWRSRQVLRSCEVGARYDVVVVGGGIFGAWSALQVARRGRSACLVERFGPGHARGSSHGDGRIYRFAYSEEHYVDMMALALVDWRSVDGVGRRVLRETGGVSMYAPPSESDGGARSHASHGDRASLAAIYAKKGLAHETLNASELSARFPQFSPPPGTLALYQPNFGVLYASKALDAVWRSLSRAGGRVLANATVLGVDSESAREGALVRTDRGDLRAGAVVVAPGAWLSEVARDWFSVDIPTTVTAETVSYFAPKDRFSALSHDHEDMPLFISDEANGLGALGYYGIPAVDVPGVKVSAHHAGYVLEDPSKRPAAVGGDGADAAAEAAAAENKAAVRAANMAFVEKVFPHLNPVPFRDENCLYTATRDMDYVIDVVAPNVVLAGGGSGHGFKMAPAVGAAAAALALGEDPPFDTGPFRLDRPGLRATKFAGQRK